MRLLYKNTLRKIRHSLGRFLSLFLIVALGIGFYAGIRGAVPEIMDVQGHYYKQTKLSDFKIVSSLGLTNKDVTLLKKSGLIVAPSFSEEALNGTHAIMVHSLTSLNQNRLIKGRQIQKDNECLGDATRYHLNQVISVKGDHIKRKTFKVVGLISNPIYSTNKYGTSSLGDGNLYSFIYVKKDVFDFSAYTEIYLRFKKTDPLYSQAYKDHVKAMLKTLQSYKKTGEEQRTEDLKAKAQKTLDQKIASFNKKKKEGSDKLAKAQKTIDTNYQTLDRNERALKAKESETYATIQSNQKKLEDSQKKISSAQKKIEREEMSLKTTLASLKTQKSTLEAHIALASGQEDALKTLNTNLAKVNAGIATIEKNQVKLENSKKSLAQNQAKTKSGLATLKTQKQKADQSFQEAKAKIYSARTKLNNAQVTLNKQKKTFDQKIKDGQKKLDKAQDQINDLTKAKWYLFDRNDYVTSYNVLESQYAIVTTIANIIPIFFMMIVMLMTSNTMTRIINEERHEMGTLASLGYKNATIIGTYLSYILSADLFGSIFGYLIGVAILPELVYNCFPLLMPDLKFTVEPLTLFGLTMMAILLTGLVTFVASYNALKAEPAILLIDNAPAPGKHLLIERFKFWKHLSFSWKITLRNFMRYKKRTWITIIASLSCVLLILIGFGLRDGIHTIGSKQYTDIFTYDDLITLQKPYKKETSALKKMLDPYTSKRIYASMNAYETDTYNFYVTALKDPKSMIHLKDIHTNKTLSLPKDGVLITRRMAEESDLQIGDTFHFHNKEGQSYKVKIQGICENYVGNYMYMIPAYYKKIFKEDVSYNTILANTEVDQKTFNKLLKKDEILNINSKKRLITTANHSISGLDEIVVMLVIISTLLATGVLYNLTSINISERQKEIATLKVLGFHNDETNGYVYRETFLAILIGVILGLIVTTLIFPFFMTRIQPTDCVFLKKISLPSYLYTALITMLLAQIMAIVTYVKVNVIDMIDALKSNE